jgi:hypothetical protein
MRSAASVLLVLALLVSACAATETPSPAAGSSTPPGLEGIAANYLGRVAISNAATWRSSFASRKPCASAP